MNKIVINACYGGFGLSKAGEELYAKYSGASLPIKVYEIPRHCPHLVRVVEELGVTAGESPSVESDLVTTVLSVETIEGDQYRILDNDGYESIETPENIPWIKINP